MCRFFLGFGMSGQSFEPEIISHIKNCLQKLEQDTAGRRCILVDGVATFAKKRHHPLVGALMQAFDAPVFLFSVAALEAQRSLLANPSLRIYVRTGCHAVAEAAALAAVDEVTGLPGQLVMEKKVYHNVTFALAQGKGKRMKEQGRDK